jgi:hypothetical protein
MTSTPSGARPTPPYSQAGHASSFLVTGSSSSGPNQTLVRTFPPVPARTGLRPTERSSGG